MKVNNINITRPSDVLVADGRVYSVRDLLGEGEITVQKVAAPFIANGRVYNIAEIEGGDTPEPGPEPEPGTKSKVKVVFHTGYANPDRMVPHLTIDDFEIKDEYFPEHGYELPAFSKTIYVENLDDIRFDGIRLINNWTGDYLRICVTHEDYPEYGNLTAGWYTDEGDMPYETASDTVTERVRRLYISETDSNIAIHFRQSDTPGPGPEPSQDTYTYRVHDMTSMLDTGNRPLERDDMGYISNVSDGYNFDVRSYEQNWQGPATGVWIFKNGAYLTGLDFSNFEWQEQADGSLRGNVTSWIDGQYFYIGLTRTKK